MSGAVFAAVLLAALLHAGWNALIKGGHDKTLDTALIHGMACMLAVPLVAVAGWPAPGAWPFVAASVAIHCGYYTALVGAYRHGDLGFAYPLMRGSAPLLVAVAGATALGERPTPLAWAGIAAVSAGVLAIGLSPSRTGGHRGKATAFALGNAAIIAAYTVVDGLGVRAAGSALSYIGTLFLLEGLPFLAVVLWLRRGDAGLLRQMRQRWPVATAGAAASLAAYGISLWAMTRAPVASVAALREVSVLFAALIGAWWLKERFGPTRAAGTALVVGGVAALRFS